MKKASKFVSFVCTAALCTVVMAGMTSCTNNNGLTGGTAATVNGVEIPEDTITTYIQNFRVSSELEDENAWGQWLANQGLTPESVREQVIDYYTNIELIKQAAAENGITVEESEINSTIDSMKANYESDEAWQAALKGAGTNEETYREQVQIALLEQDLQSVVGVPEPTSDEDLLTYAQMYSGAKRSSHILFSSDDEATATEVLAKLNSGELSFADAAAQYSLDGSKDNGGDVGWDLLTQFVDEYTNALDLLSEGQISVLVPSQFGIHIIMCTEEFNASGETLTSVSQVPSEILSSIQMSLASNAQSAAFNTWFTSYKESADVVINEIPQKVSYNIDVSRFTPEQPLNLPNADGTTGAGSGDATEGAEGAANGASDAAGQGDEAAAGGANPSGAQ